MIHGPLRRLLREPLVQFFLLGGALFCLHGLLGSRDDAAPARIEVTAGQIEHLAATFARTWQRPPTERELHGLIDDYVREEIYAREAAALGLDRDDTVIRRRLRQKMEFVTEETDALRDPTDADLRAWLAEHPDGYRLDPRFAFRQVLVSRDRHADDAEGDARALLARARPDRSRRCSRRRGGRDPAAARRAPVVAERDRAASSAKASPRRWRRPRPGSWAGPIESAYGLHLVFVERREAGRVPNLDEVRERLATDWATAQRREAIEAAYRRLRDRYTVVVDRAP